MCLHNSGKTATTLLQGIDAIDVVLERGDIVLLFPSPEEAQQYAENPTRVAPWMPAELPQPRLFIVGGYAGETLAEAVLAAGPTAHPYGVYVIVRHGTDADINRKEVRPNIRDLLGLPAQRRTVLTDGSEE